jgi:hypothetical protein
MESMVWKFHKQKKRTRILKADKGNCTVEMSEFTYKKTVPYLLKPVVYNKPLYKDPTRQTEKIQKLPGHEFVATVV